MREQRFDMIKGVAIFMVLIGHVLTFCIRGIDNAFLFKIVSAVHMPLFFFVSGWFSYKPEFKSPALLKRFRQLIVPGIICMTLFFFAFPHTGVETPFPKEYSGALYSEGKYGYWFVFCLFVIMVYYWILTKALQAVKSRLLRNFIVVIAAVIVFFTYKYDGKAAGLFEISLSALYFIPFIAGVLAKKYRSQFERLYSNGNVYMSALIIGCVCFYPITYSWEFPDYPVLVKMATPVLHICLAIVVMPLFTDWEKSAFAPEATAFQRQSAEMWAYIGRNSLGIYLLHYFFLFPLSPVRELMKGMHCGIIPTLIVSAFVAAVITAVVLLVIKIISPSRLLSELLTGNIVSRKKRE